MSLAVFLAAAFTDEGKPLFQFTREGAVVFCIGFEFGGLRVERGGESFHFSFGSPMVDWLDGYSKQLSVISNQ